MNKNINKLPVEILLKELEMLDYNSLINVCSIDRRFKAICDHHEDYLYEKMILRDIFTGNNQEFLNSLNIDTNIKPKKLYVLYSSRLIFKAIYDNNLIELEKLLRLKMVNVKDNDGDTPLIVALDLKRPLETIRLLLYHGADVNARNSDGETPLTLALKKKLSLKTITLLLDRGADVNVKNKKNLERGHTTSRIGGGQTPLILALLKKRSPEIIRLLLDRGADVNNYTWRTPLLEALYMENKSPEIIRLLLDRGADVNAMGNYLGNDTPLIVALREDYPPEIIRLLLDLGADVNIKNDSRDTPLLEAVRFYPLETISLLLERGADVNVKNNWRQTPLTVVLKKKRSPEIIRLLLDRGADVNVDGQWGATPLTLALSLNYPLETIRLLLERGADVNVKNKDGETPLIWALKEKLHLETISLLLDRGADVNVKDNNGETPLILALDKNYPPETISLLLDRGADVAPHLVKGAIDSFMETAPEIIEKELVAMKSELESESSKSLSKRSSRVSALRIGSHHNLKNGKRQTPLTLALEKNYPPETISLLLDRGAKN